LARSSEPISIAFRGGPRDYNLKDTPSAVFGKH